MNMTVHTAVKPYRMMIVVLIIMSSVLVLIGRAFDLHILDREFLQSKGSEHYLKKIPIATHRGMITDRYGELLAVSTPVDSVWVKPEEFIPSRAEWPKLAKLLGVDLMHIQRSVMKRKQLGFVYLKRHIAPKLAQQVMALGLPGVSLQREYRRYYPTGEVTSHVVGFTNIDDVGQEGMELAHNDWLSGQQGIRRVLIDRLGRVIKHDKLIKQAIPGKDLTLSIDRRLQYLAYRELKKAVYQHKAKSGSVVVLDVHTGEVLAMVNQPSYNPNNRRDLIGRKYRNRAVTDVFEPGSTIKPFTIAAALETGRYQPQTIIDTSPGILRIGRNTIHDTRNYGAIDLTRIMQKSSNVGASKLALSIPANNLWRMHTGVGFGTNSQSGFPGEVAGLVNAVSDKQRIERATLSYGYGLSVTALQLARAYSAIANKGRLVPVSFQRVDTVVEGQPVLRPRTARQVISMMETVVSEEGTGVLASIPGYRVAGKTGTVKKITLNGYSNSRYIAIFAGMIPASDPRLVMVVTIDEPSGGVYYGGKVAAPVFARVMSGAMRILDIPPDAIARGTQVAALGDKQ